jgi:hypothetical protein
MTSPTGCNYSGRVGSGRGTWDTHRDTTRCPTRSPPGSPTGTNTPPTTGIPKSCTVCGAELLNPHELTGLCRECKLVLRNERLAAETASNHRKETQPNAR